MLENPVYPALPRDVRAGVYHGDNVTGADNQQERLIEFRGWVIGFVDGEGCFSIGFIRQHDRPGRVGYRLGYQVAHEFAVTQGASSVQCLHELREFFGVGQGTSLLIFRTGRIVTVHGVEPRTSTGRILGFSST